MSEESERQSVARDMKRHAKALTVLRGDIRGCERKLQRLCATLAMARNEITALDLALRDAKDESWQP